MNFNPELGVRSLALGCLCAATLVLLPSCGSGGGTGGTQSGGTGEYVFDPAPVAELELKGTPPDGESSWSAQVVPAKAERDEKILARGRELYTKACAACHGSDGKGEGALLTKYEFNSRPANFTIPLRSIKIRSSVPNTVPADEDLFRTITRGLPGTAMLSFKNIPVEDRWALVYRIKEFWTGKILPAKVQEIPKKIASDPELLEYGKKMFVICQNCHGPQALGGTSAAYNVTTGKPYPGIAFARNGGKFMLGGSSDEDIARTLLTGFSQTSPMMNFQSMLYGDEPNAKELEAGHRKLWGTVYFTRKLIEAQAAR